MAWRLAKDLLKHISKVVLQARPNQCQYGLDTESDPCWRWLKRTDYPCSSVLQVLSGRFYRHTWKTVEQVHKMASCPAHAQAHFLTSHTSLWPAFWLCVNWTSFKSSRPAYNLVYKPVKGLKSGYKMYVTPSNTALYLTHLHVLCPLRYNAIHVNSGTSHFNKNWIYILF